MEFDRHPVGLFLRRKYFYEGIRRSPRYDFGCTRSIEKSHSPKFQ